MGRAVLHAVIATLGFLAVTSATPGATAQPSPPEPFVITDEPNDVTTHDAHELGDQPSQEHADLIRVEVTDDEWDLRVTFFLKNIETGATPLGHYGGTTNMHYRLFFTYREEPLLVEANAAAYIDQTAAGRSRLSPTAARLCTAEGRTSCEGNGQFLESRASAQEDTIAVWVSKRHLSMEDTTGPRPGHVLTEVWAQVYGTYGYDVSMRDRAPETGTKGPYTIRHEADGRALRVQPSDLTLETHLAPGHLHALDVNVTNRMSERRIIQLNASFAGDLTNASFFRLQTPRAITVPGNQSRTVRVFLDVVPEAHLGAKATVELHVRSVGFAGEFARHPWRVQVQNGFTPEANVFYAHARPLGNCYLFFTTTPCPPYYNPPPDFLSVRRADPEATAPDEMGASVSTPTYAGSVNFQVDTLTHSGLPVVLEGQGKVAFAIQINSRGTYEIDGRFRLYLLPPGRAPVLLAETTQPVTISPTENVATAEATIKNKKPAIYPRGSGLRYEFYAELPEEAGILEQRWMTVKGGVTQVRVPLIPPPPEPETVPHGAFQLRALDDPDRFVNPGEAAAFRLGLLNQLVDPQRALVTTGPLPAEWDATLDPGTTFDLLPGDHLTLVLRVRAGAKAIEGQRVTFNVTATDEAGRNATVRLRVTAVNVDVADEATKYAPDADAQERVVTPTRPTTPSLAWSAVVAAGALGWSWTRRVWRAR